LPQNSVPSGNIRLCRVDPRVSLAGVRMEQRDTATNRLRYFAIVNFVLLLNLNSAKKSFAVVLDFCNSRLSKWRRAFKPSIAITTSFNFIPAKQFLEVGEDYKQKKYEIKVKKRHNPRIIISCLKISYLKKNKRRKLLPATGNLVHGGTSSTE